jgi:hypothetical protein
MSLKDQALLYVVEASGVKLSRRGDKLHVIAPAHINKQDLIRELTKNKWRLLHAIRERDMKREPYVPPV